MKRATRGATSSCSGWPTSATSLRRRRTPPRRSRSSRAGSPISRRASRRSSSRRSASTSNSSTARRCCTKSGLSVTTTLDVEAAGGGEPRRSRAACAGYDKRRRLCGAPARNVVAEGRPSTRSRDERWNRPIAAGDIVPAVVVTRPEDRPGARCGSAAITADLAREGFAWTRRTSAADLFKPGDLIDVRVIKVDEAGATASVTPRADAARRSRARGHRQPLRPDSRDGRRLELQPQQVQSRGAGVPAARIDLQADRVHGGDRSRLHAGVDSRRRAGRLSRRATARSTARRTTTTSSRGPSRCAMRSRTRATFRRSR